ncbi:energy transducer TonB [Ideonella azotifigens]|uniref:energy transducer TonB n=1 Tax=Ideonella azotifigens TaxID=513160 RepID=UPI0014774094|nr:TonB family protein [Ideonella azotifigens]MCD2339471.1 energy transducer TonB [Ideonella azotifigens]
MDIRFRVSAAGELLQVEQVGQTRYPDFDNAMLAALKTCRFQPGTVEGKPAESVGQIFADYVSPNKIGDTNMAQEQRMRVDVATCAPTGAEYPPESASLDERGTANVTITVSAEGKLEKAVIRDSSGYPRLDEASLKVATRCKFAPGRNLFGGDQGATLTINYRWTLEER